MLGLGIVGMISMMNDVKNPHKVSVEFLELGERAFTVDQNNMKNSWCRKNMEFNFCLSVLIRTHHLCSLYLSKYWNISFYNSFTDFCRY